jgi:hypothetical protein
VARAGPAGGGRPARRLRAGHGYGADRQRAPGRRHPQPEPPVRQRRGHPPLRRRPEPAGGQDGAGPGGRHHLEEPAVPDRPDHRHRRRLVPEPARLPESAAGAGAGPAAGQPGPVGGRHRPPGHPDRRGRRPGPDGPGRRRHRPGHAGGAAPPHPAARRRLAPGRRPPAVGPAGLGSATPGPAAVGGQPPPPPPPQPWGQPRPQQSWGETPPQPPPVQPGAAEDWPTGAPRAEAPPRGPGDTQRLEPGPPPPSPPSPEEERGPTPPN